MSLQGGGFVDRRELDIYDPFRSIKKSFFEDMFEPFQKMTFPEVRTPLINLMDKGDSIVVSVEVPGAEKKDINVDATEDSISVEANMKKEEKEKDKDYYRYEMRTSSFSRIIPMPEKIVPEKVTGKLNKGILELNAPKVSPKEASKKKRVEISE